MQGSNPLFFEDLTTSDPAGDVPRRNVRTSNLSIKTGDPKLSQPSCYDTRYLLTLT